ncbi:prepilin-type N-terminal cleavage/methylation domain-containing protein [Streptomyces sp. NBC_00083]|uniref:prepilin-type N-terminal cleavage/methylation domain-containing protein n=1 Tax=Streptomyces sp. NBC_00083 TaxID=2975647 RepID=UPI0022573F1E|nr:prepilin-type N-terminal cleavage/methylation domain-containing protein [Streptomyces sp. NBC_00083]MCX5384164.1 prepilin-type N-terminal cleavage/methylation domain-containing protein [Streptomyces sp. NBC_00083]
MTTPRPTARPESGFTLVELLVTLVILGIIGALLPQAIILGLRFTAGTEQKVAATGALGTLNRYYYGDVQSADSVTTGPACGAADVIVHLSWTGTDVVYTYDPPTGALNRVKCTAGGVVTTVLGRFDPTTSSHPVTLSCGAETSCTRPMEVTLTVQSDPAAPPTALTAARRSSAS